MRDIRADLRERIASIGERYANEMAQYQAEREVLDDGHRDTMMLLDRERMAVEQLLAIEEQRQGVPAAAAEVRKTARMVALTDFLVTKVHADGPMEKEQLRAEANLAGYENGRAFHTTLMNITKGGRLTLLPDGRYAFPQRPPAMFSEQQMEGEMQTLM